MASLDILCSNPLNLKNKTTKIEHKKIFCGLSKTLKNISWPINICISKYFMTSTKILWPPLIHTSCTVPAAYIKYVRGGGRGDEEDEAEGFTNCSKNIS